MQVLTFSGDGNSASFDIHSNKMAMMADGTFGGGTVQAQVSPDGTTWFDVPSGSLTAKGLVDWYLPANFARVSITGSTTPNVTVWLFGV